mmetsp:Transcript_25323/g.60227  ORF Transcript_25323/g.60227 Transcript_25323/m.60227 type:complete len:270 (+) Transcript_25323:1765-2574(+)
MLTAALRRCLPSRSSKAFSNNRRSRSISTTSTQRLMLPQRRLYQPLCGESKSPRFHTPAVHWKISTHFPPHSEHSAFFASARSGSASALTALLVKSSHRSPCCSRQQAFQRAHPCGVTDRSIQTASKGGANGFSASHSERFSFPASRSRARSRSVSVVSDASRASCNDAAHAAASSSSVPAPSEVRLDRSIKPWRRRTSMPKAGSKRKKHNPSGNVPAPPIEQPCCNRLSSSGVITHVPGLARFRPMSVSLQCPDIWQRPSVWQGRTPW